MNEELLYLLEVARDTTKHRYLAAKIAAIKLYWNEHACSLKEAKETIEEWIANPPPTPDPIADAAREYEEIIAMQELMEGTK